jgi:hypothetical protein
LDEFAAELTQQRFSTDTVRRSLCAADRFGAWLSAQGLYLRDARQTTVDRYLVQLGLRFSIHITFRPTAFADTIQRVVQPTVTRERRESARR